MPGAKHQHMAGGQPLWQPAWPRWSRELSPLSDGVAMWSGPSIHASTLSSHRRPLPGTSYQPRAIAIAILLPCTPWTSYARSISLTDRREVEQQSHSHALNQLTYPLHSFVQRWDGICFDLYYPIVVKFMKFLNFGPEIGSTWASDWPNLVRYLNSFRHRKRNLNMPGTRLPKLSLWVRRSSHARLERIRVEAVGKDESSLNWR